MPNPTILEKLNEIVSKFEKGKKNEIDTKSFESLIKMIPTDDIDIENLNLQEIREQIRAIGQITQNIKTDKKYDSEVENIKKLILYQNKLIIHHRKINEKKIKENLKFLNEISLSTPEDKPIYRINRKAALENTSTGVDIVQQKEMEEEEQEEQEQEQENEQQAQMQQQRQALLESLEKRKKDKGRSELDKKRTDGFLNIKDIKEKLEKNYNEKYRIDLLKEVLNKLETDENQNKPDNPLIKEFKTELARINNEIENHKNIFLNIFFENKKVVAFTDRLIVFLIEHPDFTKSGLLIDPLPPGFKIYESENNSDELLLDFDIDQYENDLKNNEQENNESEIVSHFKLTFEAPLYWEGDEKQFPTSPGFSKENFNLLLDVKSFRKLSSELQLSLLSEILQIDTISFPQEKENIKNIFTLLKPDSKHMFLKIFSENGFSGTYAVSMVLEKINSKYNPEIADRFFDVIIKGNSSFLETILSHEGKKSLESLMKWNETELNTFLDLALSDKSNGTLFKDPNVKSFDLLHQINNFTIFKSKLFKLGISLDTLPLNLAKNPYLTQGNMAVVMQKIISILENSVDPRSQFKELEKIDLNKAYHAIVYEKQYLATASMGFDQEHYDDLLKKLNEVDPLVPLSSTFLDFIHIEPISKNISSWEKIYSPGYHFSCLFLRALSKKSTITNIDEYLKIISLYENAAAETKKPPYIIPTLALALTAFCTTHEKVLKFNPEIYTQILLKLESLNIKHFSFQHYNQFCSYLHLIEDDTVKQPMPEQILSLILFHHDLGNEHDWNKTESVKSLSLAKTFGEVFFDVIHDNYLYRSDEKAKISANKIALVAEIIAKNFLMEDIDNRKKGNKIFKIISHLNLEHLDETQLNTEIENLMGRLLSYNGEKINQILDTMSTLKFKGKDAYHPDFDNLKSILDKLNDPKIKDKEDIFKVIRENEGYRDVILKRPEAAKHVHHHLKDLVSEYLPDIKNFIQSDPFKIIEWDAKFEENPELLISIVLNKSKESPFFKKLVNKIIGPFLSMLEAQTKESVDSHILYILKESEKDENETNRIVEFIENKFLKKIVLDKNLGDFDSSVENLKKFEEHTTEFVTELKKIKILNPIQYRNVIKFFHQSEHLDKISLENLTTLLSALRLNYKTKFPSSIIDTVVNHHSFKDIKPENINLLIKEILIPEIINNKNLGLSLKETKTIISSVIKMATSEKTDVDKIKSILNLLKNKQSKAQMLKVIEGISETPTSELIENISSVCAFVEKISTENPEFCTLFYQKTGNIVEDLSSIGAMLRNEGLGLTEEQIKYILIILTKTQYKFQDVKTKNTENTLPILLNFLSTKGTIYLKELSEFSPSFQITFPTAKEIMQGIKEKKSASELLQGLRDKLEKGRNDPVKLAKLFDESQVLRVLENMQDLNHDKSLGYPVKKLIYKQFKAVNYLGKNYLLSIDLNNHQSGKKYIKNMDDADIKLLISQYRQLIRDETKSEKEKNNAKLVYLALLRESMYRTTGRFPFSTQMIAVLNALHQGGNNIAEIQTGQGKSLISALYATMLQAEGQAVDIATSNLNLAKEGLKENQDFYDYIGVKTSIVTASMDFSDYHLDGINYGDVPQLALLRSRALIEHAKLPERASLVLDEADYTLLDDKTEYRYAASLDTKTSNKNIYEWVYPLINKFIDYSKNNVNISEEPEVLRNYLLSEAKTTQIKSIQNFSTEELRTWLHSAITAEGYYEQEGTKWKLVEKLVNGQKVSIAELIINDAPSPATRWGKGVHQLLHARINARIIAKNENIVDPDKIQPLCIIEPETTAAASLTSKNFLDFYKERKGKIWGITGTIGSKEERQEHADKLGFKLSSIPSHQENLRKTHDPILIDSDDKHKKEIFDQILRRIRKKEKMPALIICKDPNDAKALHDFIKNELSNQSSVKHYPLCLQLLSATELNQNKFPASHISEPEPNEPEKSLNDYIQQAGVAGTITIATPMVGRGTDFKPVEEQINETTQKREPHPHGLFVVQSYLDISRNERQVHGRSGRQGAKGEAITILSKKTLLEDFEAVGISQSPNEIKKRKLLVHMEKIRAKRNVSAKTQREQSEALGDIRNIYFKKMLLLLDSLEEYYQTESIKVDSRVAAYPDVALYKVKFLKQWERFLLDLDLANAKLLKPDTLASEKKEKLSTKQLAEQLLNQANTNWANYFYHENNFKSYIDSIPDTKPLSEFEIATKLDVVLSHTSSSHKLLLPDNTNRKLSPKINTAKFVCEAVGTEQTDQKTVNAAINFALNKLYLKTLKLTKTRKKKDFNKLSIPEKIRILHPLLYQSQSNIISQSSNSPKVFQYQALINKFEKEVNWFIEKNPSAGAGAMIYEVRNNHSYYLIQHARSTQLFKYQQTFKDKISSQAIINNTKKQAHISAKQFRAKLFQEKTGIRLANAIIKSIGNYVILDDDLLNFLSKQRKIAYFGNKNNKPLSPESKYHDILDNILMGYIASTHKSTLEKVYQAEIKDIYILLEYINRKYSNNSEVFSACKDLQYELKSDNLNLSQVQKKLEAIQLSVSSKALRNNLSTKINHLNEISIRKSTDHLEFKKVDFTNIQFEPYTPKVSKMPKIRSFKKVSPSEDLPPPLILSQIHTPSPNSEIVIATNSQNEPTDKAPISLLNKILPQKEIVYKFGKKTNSGQVTIAELRVDKTNQSARITKPLHVKVDSEDFLDATKKAIDKIISLPSTNSETLFTISNKLSKREQRVLSNYITEKLSVRFPNKDNPLAIRNQIKLGDNQTDPQRTRPGM